MNALDLGESGLLPACLPVVNGRVVFFGMVIRTSMYLQQAHVWKSRRIVRAEAEAG